MRAFVTILTGGAALLTIAAHAAFALPAFSYQRAEVFAVCAGRMAALAAHERNMHDTHAPDIQRMQDEFDLLLDAIMPYAVDDGVPVNQARLWQAQGWTEMAGYLAEMHYSFDTTIVQLANEAADDRIGQCRGLLLPEASNG